MREGRGHGLSDREQALLQAVNEKGQTQHHEQHAHQYPAHVGQGLLQHEKLKEHDDEQNRRQVAQAAQHRGQELLEDFSHAVSLPLERQE